VWTTSIELALAMVLLTFCACATSGNRTAPTSEAARIPPVEWTVSFTGAGLERPQEFSYRRLAEMEMVPLVGVMQHKTHFPDERKSWRGPLLADLFHETGLKPGPMRITLEALDGYEKSCRVDDLDSAIIAVQDGEGRWLAERGRVILVFVPPKLMGDFWIRNLTRIHCEPMSGEEPSG